MRGGGALALAGAFLLLSACQREPDFDERYEAAEAKIRQTAAEMDRQLAEAERKRRAAEGEAADPPTGGAVGGGAPPST